MERERVYRRFVCVCVVENVEREGDERIELIEQIVQMQPICVFFSSFSYPFQFLLIIYKQVLRKEKAAQRLNVVGSFQSVLRHAKAERLEPVV